MNDRHFRLLLGSRLLFAAVLPLCLLVAGPALAQQPACELTRNPARDLLVITDTDPSHPEVKKTVELAFDQILTHHEPAIGVVTAHRALREAESGGAPCSEAFATYLLAFEPRQPEAIALAQRAETLFAALHSMSGVAHAQLRIANLYAARNQFDEAIKQYQRAAATFDSIPDPYGSLKVRIRSFTAQRTPDYAAADAEAASLHAPCLQAAVQQDWGGSAYRGGRLDEASRHYFLADSAFALCPESDAARAGIQTDLGRLEREQGRVAAALEHYRIALRLQQKSGDLSYLPQTYNAMAVAWESVEDWAHAIPLFLRGLAAARQIHSQDFIDFLEANLGTAYAHDGRAKLAVPLLERTTRNLTSNYLRCVRLDQLGFAYMAAGDPGKAVVTLNTALTACRVENNTSRILLTLENLSLAELKLANYDQALVYARESTSLTEQTRSHVIAQDAYKKGFITQHAESYDYTIAALTALHRASEALEVAEQARARAFLDLLASRPATTPQPSGTPLDRHSLAQYRKDLIASPASATPLAFDAMIEEAGRLHSSLLAYWLTKDTLYLWLAKPGEPVVEATSPITPARLTALVAATSKAGSPAWRTLYRLLIAPVEDHLPSNGALLTIVPCGPLFALSFPALTAPDGTYLVERFRTHTIPSVGTLTFTRHNAEVAAALPPHSLFLADPASLPGALAPLPGTAVEVAAILKTMPAGQHTQLEGLNANATQLRAHLAGATTLHFATHAVLNGHDPYASYLALDDTAHDGRLTVAEIYALPLTSRLVVLSACGSALGKVTGDGVDGMSRAFFYAGSAAVLSTLWKITDRSTAAFLPRFYKALAANQPPGTALRTAQLGMLHDLRRRRIRLAGLNGAIVLPPDPLYWAAFALAGEP